MDHVMAKKREKFDDFNSNNRLDLYSDRDKSIIKGFRRIIESGNYIYCQIIRYSLLFDFFLIGQ